MHTKPEVVRVIVQHVVDCEVEVTRRFLGACNGMLDIAYFLGTTSAPSAQDKQGH